MNTILVIFIIITFRCKDANVVSHLVGFECFMFIVIVKRSDPRPFVFVCTNTSAAEALDVYLIYNNTLFYLHFMYQYPHARPV